MWVILNRSCPIKMMWRTIWCHICLETFSKTITSWPGRATHAKMNTRDRDMAVVSLSVIQWQSTRQGVSPFGWPMVKWLSRFIRDRSLCQPRKIYSIRLNPNGIVTLAMIIIKIHIKKEKRRVPSNVPTRCWKSCTTIETTTIQVRAILISILQVLRFWVPNVSAQRPARTSILTDKKVVR